MPAVGQHRQAQQHHAEDHAEQHLGPLGPGLTRGSLNSGTPLAIASTPVSALHPAEKAFRTSSTLTASSGTRGQQRTAGQWGVQGQRVDQADDDDGQQADDEDHRGQQERPGRLPQAAQVEHGDNGEDAQADRHRGRGRGTGKAEVSAATPAAMETATVSV